MGSRLYDDSLAAAQRTRHRAFLFREEAERGSWQQRLLSTSKLSIPCLQRATPFRARTADSEQPPMFIVPVSTAHHFPSFPHSRLQPHDSPARARGADQGSSPRIKRRAKSQTGRKRRDVTALDRFDDGIPHFANAKEDVTTIKYMTTPYSSITSFFDLCGQF
jgi:hypothetical protein